MLYFFLFFLNLTTQSGFYMTAPCGAELTAAQCMTAPPLDAGSFGTTDLPVMVKAVGLRSLPSSIEFGAVNIVLASAPGVAPVARSWPQTPFDVAPMLNPYRAAKVTPDECYVQNVANHGLSRPVAGGFDSRSLCLSALL